MNAEDIYFGTKMERWDCLFSTLTQIIDDIITEYNLRDIENSNYIMLCEIYKGMHDLPQVDCLVYDKQNTYLASSGIPPKISNTSHCGWFWRNIYKSIWRTISRRPYQQDKRNHHRLDEKSIQRLPSPLGLRVAYRWAMDLHYIEIALSWFKHNCSDKLQGSRHPWSPPKYRSAPYYTLDISDTLLTPAQLK